MGFGLAVRPEEKLEQPFGQPACQLYLRQTGILLADLRDPIGRRCRPHRCHSIGRQILRTVGPVKGFEGNASFFPPVAMAAREPLCAGIHP